MQRNEIHGEFGLSLVVEENKQLKELRRKAFIPLENTCIY